MEITFRDRKLQKQVNDHSRAQRELGTVRADKLRQRLGQLRGADTLEDVRDLPGHYHELTSNRKGQWACDLDGAYRLVFTPQAAPIPTDENGRYIWVEIQAVEILEITNYHKER